MCAGQLTTPVLWTQSSRPGRPGADELCPAAEIGVILRYLAGRRVATKVTTDVGSAVLKVFARPRARGNHRRMQVLAASPAAALVPPSFGADSSGHVSLVGWMPGQVLDQLPDTDFVRRRGARRRALAGLHGAAPCSTANGRSRRRLACRSGARAPQRPAAVGRTRFAASGALETPLVPSHRDCHPRQVVCERGGAAVDRPR